MNLASRLSDTLDQDASARAFLGAEHPLARACEWLSALLRQALVLAALGALGLIALAEGIVAAPALLASVAAVGLALGLAGAALGHRKRRHALHLIAAGREDLPIAAVRRERCRLREPRHRDELAHWLDAICREAQHVGPRPLYARPLFFPPTIRAVQSELAEIASALGRKGAGARGVLRLQRLLEQGGSPLYGHDAEALRQELRVIRFLLDC